MNGEKSEGGEAFFSWRAFSFQIRLRLHISYTLIYKTLLEPRSSNPHAICISSLSRLIFSL